MRISDGSSDVCASALAKPMAAAAPPQRIEGGGMGETGNRLWLAGFGVAVLLALAFWLGGRFGGGMSQSEVETVVAAYIKANPQIIPEALEAHRAREINDRKGRDREQDGQVSRVWGGADITQ